MAIPTKAAFLAAVNNFKAAKTDFDALQFKLSLQDTAGQFQAPITQDNGDLFLRDLRITNTKDAVEVATKVLLWFELAKKDLPDVPA